MSPPMEVYTCGRGHPVALDADTPPFEAPPCPWCRVEELEEEVERLRGALRLIATEGDLWSRLWAAGVLEEAPSHG